jgi:hypothetical protein
VLRRVLEHPVAAIAVLQAVHRERLEATPPQGHHQRVARLQDLAVPPVLLHADLKQKQAKRAPLLCVIQAACQERVATLPINRGRAFSEPTVLPVLLHTDLHKRGERKFQRHGLSCVDWIMYLEVPRGPSRGPSTEVKRCQRIRTFHQSFWKSC